MIKWAIQTEERHRQRERIRKIDNNRKINRISLLYIV